MSLLKLKSAPVVLIEDDYNKNIIPLLFELISNHRNVILFNNEQSADAWKSIIDKTINPNVKYCEEFMPLLMSEYTSVESTVVIASINQWAISIGWNQCLRYVKKICSQSNIKQVVIVFHKDCLSPSSRLQIYLNHMANAIVSYDPLHPCKVKYTIKKGAKVFRSEEILSYDTKTSSLRSTPIVKEEIKDDEPEKPSLGSLTTFKIEVDQIEKMERSNLKLPYMSKINEGEGKVYYEPDAVDDWDEEDPDEDLDL